jgi:hypothetical protein
MPKLGFFLVSTLPPDNTFLQHSFQFIITCPTIRHYKEWKTDWLHGAEPFLKSRPLCSYSRISQQFLEPEGSLSRSQESSTGPYTQPDQSSLYPF